MRIQMPTAPAKASSFRLVRQSRTGIEIRDEDGRIFAFMLNPAHTGLVDCRRPNEDSRYDIYRGVARRFAETHAHAAGLIWCPSAAA